MFALDPNSAALYLEERGWKCLSSPRPLGGGVSNTVLLAETPAGPLVLKQALEKLRVDADWRSRPDRTLREARALLAVAPLLPAGAIPRVEFVDEANFIYAMRAGSEVDWKSELLAGRVEPEVARQAGEILGTMIAGTWMNPEWAREFGDQTVFEELRLDPYYHYTAARFGELAPYFERLATQCRKRRVSLVHGDWSPKNLLTGGPQVMAIDFEVVHYGDPSFDCGFLFNHLLLKSVHRPEWAERYLKCAQTFWLAVSGRVPPEAHWLLPASLEQLGGLLAARVAGKSPAEYLDGPGRAKAWGLAGRILREKPVRLEEIWHWI